MMPDRLNARSVLVVVSTALLVTVVQGLSEKEGISAHYSDDEDYMDYLDEMGLNAPPENLFCGPKELPNFGPSIVPEKVVSFYAMGDIPTYADDRYCLNQQLRELNTSSPDGPSFIVHVGDTKQTGKAYPCNAEAYNDIAEIFTHPDNALGYEASECFFMPGDNEWVDCRPAESKEPAFALWQQHFGLDNPYGFGTLANRNVEVVRQTDVERLPGVDRSENFAFFLDQVLFMSVNIVGGKVYGDEELRFKQNFNWTRDQLALHKPQGMKAAVIFSHAFLKPGIKREFYGYPLWALLREEYPQMPVMYLHGDGHEYCVRYPDDDNQYFVDIMVDEGKYAPPIEVSILKHPNKEEYIFDIDRRGGYYEADCPGIREKTWDSPGLPGFRDKPTSQPTTPPTKSPTNSPTSSPTRTPTLRPTVKPTSFPTASPTLSPTRPEPALKGFGLDECNLLSIGERCVNGADCCSGICNGPREDRRICIQTDCLDRNAACLEHFACCSGKCRTDGTCK